MQPDDGSLCSRGPELNSPLFELPSHPDKDFVLQFQRLVLQLIHLEPAVARKARKIRVDAYFRLRREIREIVGGAECQDIG